MGERWTADEMPDQTGRTALVTGANSGLGLVTARELARAGARVVMACRSAERAGPALEHVRAAAPGADVSVEPLDLASQGSIRELADRFLAGGDGLDLLVNNAGIMATPRAETADGFELHLGTNHLGHFALTARLVGAMREREDARVVTLSSFAHKLGRIRFDDLDGHRRYGRWRAYCQSKLANLLFALELDRRLRAAGWPVKSIAAHPGYSHTNLQSAAAPALDRAIMAVTNRLGAQDAEGGAQPTLYAATKPDLPGGSYVGPDGFAELGGLPQLATPSRTARDEALARRLWEVSEELTGVRFDLAPTPAPAAG